MKKHFIKILFKDGGTVILDEDEWDYCSYDGKAFVVKKEGSLVGLYNVDSVVSIVVKTAGKNEGVPIAIGHSMTPHKGSVFV